VQLHSFRHGVAAMFRHIGITADMCAGHKEYCLPAARPQDRSGRR
jgi:hypothetical protein